MLAVSPLGNPNDEREGELESFPVGADDDFLDFASGNLLDSIDFDDLFVGFEDGDILPDLEMDPEILAEFSFSSGEESETRASVSTERVEENRREEEDKVSSWYPGPGPDLSSSQGEEETVIKRDESVIVKQPRKEADKGRKSSVSQAKNSSRGKRKMKVDWTPELHRRFVQAVEQLGVDKAVPSRILELMGIDCLTRHNIASHLQKYRSHRKHLLARGAEVASWSQRRQMYGGAGGGSKRTTSPWVAPTMGFPPPPPTPLQPFRSLHVWGHPTADRSSMHMWPKHLVRSPSPPPPTWIAPPPPPPPDPSYWHPHHQRVPNAFTQGAPCFPPPTLVTTRFATPPVPGIPSHAMYKVDQGSGVPTAHSDSNYPPFDFHPSKESIDAALGDVLSEPWLPLPLGLKPPSLESVVAELHHQGIAKIPPACA